MNLSAEGMPLALRRALGRTKLELPGDMEHSRSNIAARKYHKSSKNDLRRRHGTHRVARDGFNCGMVGGASDERRGLRGAGGHHSRAARRGTGRVDLWNAQPVAGAGNDRVDHRGVYRSGDPGVDHPADQEGVRVSRHRVLYTKKSMS